MHREITERWRHFRESLLRPLWVWLIVGFVGLVGNTQTLVGLLPANLSTAIDAWITLPTLAPLEWMIAALIGLLFVLFEGSFQVRKRAETDRDEARDSLEAMGLERPLIFTGIETRLSSASPGIQSAQLLGYKIELENDGAQRIRYRVLRTDMRGAGLGAVFPPAVNPSGIIAGRKRLSYFTGDALQPLVTSALNGVYEAEFEVEYDTIPPTRVRNLSMLLSVRSDFIIGGKCDYIILEQHER